MARKIRSWKFWCHWYAIKYILSYRSTVIAFFPGYKNHFPVCSIKYAIGKIELFLKAAKNVKIISVVYICSNGKRDRGFMKRIYVLANRAAELRSSGATGRGVKNDPDWGGQEVTTWTHVRSTGRTGFAIKILRKNCSRIRARIRKTGSHNAETGGSLTVGLSWRVAHGEGYVRKGQVTINNRELPAKNRRLSHETSLPSFFGWFEDRYNNRNYVTAYTWEY